MNHLKFINPTGVEIHVGLTSGHTAVIPAEAVDADTAVPLAPIFQREAIARGAMPIQIAAAQAEVVAQAAAPNRNDLIKAALQAMLDGGDEGDFKADGTPNLVKLGSRAGFQIAREEADAAWAEVVAEAQARVAKTA